MSFFNGVKILTGQSSSLPRKGLLRGGLVGLLLTVLIHGIAIAPGPHESAWGLLIFFPWCAIIMPTWVAYHVLGWSWNVGEYRAITPTMFTTMVILNYLIAAGLGWAIASLLQWIKNRRNNSTLNHR